MLEITQLLLLIITLIVIVSIMFVIIIIPPGATSVRARGRSALARWRRRSPSADADARRVLRSGQGPHSAPRRRRTPRAQLRACGRRRALRSERATRPR